jgi:hypothetical protein
MDLIEFQWDKYQRPRFVINFQSVTGKDAIAVWEASPIDHWGHMPYFRAYQRRRLFPLIAEPLWFHIGPFARRLTLDWSVRTVVDGVLVRLVQIDRVLNEGLTFQNIRKVG